jgi:hypothetical protein
MMSTTVVSAGAACFGIVVGYITYRTLVRNNGTGNSQISDLAAVIAAVGGGTVTTFLNGQKTDAFAYYSMGLLGGMALYFGLSVVLRGKATWISVMGGEISNAGGSGPPPPVAG